MLCANETQLTELPFVFTPRFHVHRYRKLLGADLGLCDLAGWMPEVAHGLAALIKCVFCLVFISFRARVMAF